MSQSHTYFAGGGVRYVTNTAPDGTSTIQQFENGRLISAETRNPELGTLNAAVYAYDAHNRQSTNTDAHAGSTVFIYDNADRLTSVSTPNPGTGSQVTSNTYNNMGWITSVKLPDGQTVTKEYYTNGLLKKTYGARTYPVEYTYDYAGRLKAVYNIKTRLRPVYVYVYTDIPRVAGCRLDPLATDNLPLSTFNLQPAPNTSCARSGSK